MRHRIFQEQHVDDGAHDDQRDERREEGAQAQIADQHAVHQADSRAAGKRRGDDSRDAAISATLSRASATMLPSAKVEPTLRSMPPATMTIISARTMKAELAQLPHQVGDVGRAEEIGDQRSEHGHDRKQDQQRDGVVDPALGRGSRRAGDRGRGGSASARSCLTTDMRVLLGCRTMRPARASFAARAATRRSALRPARFQQEAGFMLSLVRKVSGVKSVVFVVPGRLLELQQLLDHVGHVARLARHVVDDDLGIGAVGQPVAGRRLPPPWVSR